VSNLTGLIPGFLPPTSHPSTNFAISITVFLFYNYEGVRENGVGYLKHFLGPVLFLAPMMVILELIQHIVRPASLGLRLLGNISGDHMVLGLFSDLTPLVLPVIFFGLGLFVSFIQAFVFTLLSTIYISMAIAHDH
jgi:F-type H+-transporting ATPase subunit a